MERLVLFAVIILIVGALYIVQEQKTDFKKPNSAFLFTKIYLKWVWQAGTNVKNIIVYAANMDWLPEMPKENLSLTENYKNTS